MASTAFYLSDSSEESEHDHQNDDEHLAEVHPRVIIFLDVDSFEVQVWGRKFEYTPEQLKTLPFIVINDHGVITAVNYVAKDYGIKREKLCTPDKAKKLCPNLVTLTIPQHHSKPDALFPKMESNRIYKAVADSLLRHCYIRPIIEFKPKDEFYIDVTDEILRWIRESSLIVPSASLIDEMKKINLFLETKTGTVSGDSFRDRVLTNVPSPKLLCQETPEVERLLVLGGALAHLVLKDIYKDTGYVLSSGVGSNKLVAKIAGGYRKPNGLCILPKAAFKRVRDNLKLKDCPGLAGKLGQKIQKQLEVETLGQLALVDEDRLIEITQDTGRALQILHQWVNGVDFQPVVENRFNKTLQCGVTFGSSSRNMWRNSQTLFLDYIRGRFLEMRDHLIYEVGTFGYCRMPVSLGLSIKTRKTSMKSPFNHTLQLPLELMDTINLESSPPGGVDQTTIEKYLKGQWQVIFEKFLAQIREKSILKVFHSDYHEACAQIRKVSAITLVANFNSEQ